MKPAFEIATVVIIAALAAVAAFLKTPAAQPLDAASAIAMRANYDPRIIRDSYGVPHIYGARDADVAFGLAYAHAEDDWETIEEVILFSRGALAQAKGKDAAIPDFLINTLGANQAIEHKYHSDLSDETRALVDAYAAGVNYFCAVNRRRCSPYATPVSGKDIVAGFATRTPFFYGLDDTLTELFASDPQAQASINRARVAFFGADEEFERGSNAMAVSPPRSADNHTRLMVNSHQPYEGPVAWYEARVKSDEGWDMIGGLFPGAPLILHGAGPSLGWAFTVNKPDLVDIYELQTDDAKNPKAYLFGGEWRSFESRQFQFRVRLWGPFSLPVNRTARRSVHGPVLEQGGKHVAIAFAGDEDVRAVEQWRRMNKATNFDAWRDAMSMTAIPSFNVIYADGAGNIAYYYNAAIPKRNAGADWTSIQDGANPELVWGGTRDFSEVPRVVNPVSGYVANANNSPFEASAPGDNPDEARYPPHFGVDRKTTNRGLREQALYGADTSITAEEFVAYKFDANYANESRLKSLFASISEELINRHTEDEKRALTLAAGWNGSVDRNNQSAALAILTGRKILGPLLEDGKFAPEAVAAAIIETAAELKAGFGRIDPKWSDVVRLKRGDADLALDGGPDTLRAVYPIGDPADGAMRAVGGDTYILYADWRAPGDVAIRTIHQYGAATSRANSPHYDDQAALFAAEEWKSPPMDLDALLREASADYRP